MNTYTTLEESKQLIEAGLDVNTADGYLRHKWEEITQNHHFQAEYGEKIPCWSLAALLEIMPKRLYINNNAWEAYCPVIYLGEKYVIGYQHSNTFIHMEYSDTSMKAVTNMIIWLLKNNYIKSNKNE